MYRLLFLLCLFNSPVSWAEAVNREGKLWIQPSDVAPITWFEVDAVCPEPDRVCNGTLNSVDVSGFRWATAEELNALFASYDDFATGGTDTTIDALMADFTPIEFVDGPVVAGWSSEEDVPSVGLVAGAADAPALSLVGITDFFGAFEDKGSSTFDFDLPDPPGGTGAVELALGAWLWRSAGETAALDLVLEEPVDGEVHGGVGNLRGWAVSSEAIDRIEIYIDGEFAFNAPYGGSRPDVAELFPAVPGSEQSGFSLAYGYSNLEAGIHTITAKAITAEGSVAESTSTFTVVRFDEIFIGPEQTVDTSQAVISTVGDEILMNGVIVGEKNYDLRLKWRTAEQGFEIIEIQ